MGLPPPQKNAYTISNGRELGVLVSFLCVVLGVLELDLQTRLSLNSQRFWY